MAGPRSFLSQVEQNRRRCDAIHDLYGAKCANLAVLACNSIIEGSGPSDVVHIADLPQTLTVMVSEPLGRAWRAMAEIAALKGRWSQKRVRRRLLEGFSRKKVGLAIAGIGLVAVFVGVRMALAKRASRGRGMGGSPGQARCVIGSAVGGRRRLWRMAAWHPRRGAAARMVNDCSRLRSSTAWPRAVCSGQMNASSS